MAGARSGVGVPPFNAALTLAGFELRRAFSPGRWLPVLGLTLLPVLPLWVGVVRETGPRAFFWTTTILQLSLIPMGLGLLVGLGIVSSLFQEPLSPYKFAGILSRGAMFALAVGVGVLFVTAHQWAGVIVAQAVFSPEAPEAAFRNAVRMGILAGAAGAFWVTYFVSAGCLFARPLAPSAGAALIFELVLSLMPFEIAAYSVTNTLRALVRRWIVVDGLLPGRWYNIWQGRVDFQEPTGAVVYLAILWLVVLGIGWAAIRRRAPV